MYICLCKAVTDGQIRQAVHDGAGSLRAVRDELGIMTTCGKCACEARDLVKNTLEENTNNSQFYSAA